MHRRGAERVADVPRAARCWARPGRRTAGERAPHHRHVPDPVARPGVRVVRRRAVGRHARRAVPRRRARRAVAGGDDGWRVPVPRARCRRDPSRAVGASTDPRAAARPPRDARGARRGTAAEEDELPISLSVAFERLRQIRSFYFFLVGMAALGLALFSTPLFLSLYFDDQLGLDAFQRGIDRHRDRRADVARDRGVGRRADALFRRSPPDGDGVRRPAHRPVRRRPRARDLDAERVERRARARARHRVRAAPRS